MRRIRFDWRMTVRLLGALALVLVAFAHRPPAPLASDLPDAAAYALPDGSIPVICVTGPSDEGGSQTVRHALPCDACLITGSVLLPQPGEMIAPAYVFLPAEPPSSASPVLRRSAWPPSAPPTAPPLA